MTTKPNRTHAVSMLAGLAVVSSSLLTVFLGNSAGETVRAAGACASNSSIHTTAASRAAIGPEHARGSRSIIRLTAWTAGTGSNKADSRSTASQSPSPGSPSFSPAVSPSPSPSTPKPTPSQAKPSPSAPAPTPSTTSPSPSTSPTPTPTHSSTPPPQATLCLSIQSLSGTQLRAGAKADYAIWVWLTAGTNGSATVRLTAQPSDLSPTFTVCQPAGGTSCSLSGLAADQQVELQAQIPVPKSDAGGQVTLTATGTSPEASTPTIVSDTLTVQAKASPSPTPSQPATSPGDGGGLPPNILPPGSIPGLSIPGLPNPTSNPGAAFPQVVPTTSPSPHAQTPARAIRAADVSAGLPLNVRLIGGQLIGLAILAAAVMIAVARMSLRKRPRRGDDS